MLRPRKLQRASRRAQIRGTSLIEQLHDLGYLTECRVAIALAEAVELELLDLNTAQKPDDPESILPLAKALNWKLVPAIVNGEVQIATACPLDPEMVDDLEPILDAHNASLVVAEESKIRAWFNELYGVSFPRCVGVYEDVVNGDDLSASAMFRSDDEDETNATRLVEMMLEDAALVEGDVHLLRSVVGHRACLCVGDELDELFQVPACMYAKIESHLRSEISGDENHGEFTKKIGNANVEFLLDVDEGEDGTQLFISFLDRVGPTAEPTKVRVVFELPLAAFEVLEEASTRKGISPSAIVERLWQMTENDIENPCWCPYVEPSTTKTTFELTLSPETLEGMQKTARANNQTLDWVLHKIFLMTRECVRR